MHLIALIVNLTQLRITWEGSLNEEFSTWGRSVAMSFGNSLKLIEVGRLSPLWATPFPWYEAVLELYQGEEMKLSTSKHAGMHAFIFLYS